MKKTKKPESPTTSFDAAKALAKVCTECKPSTVKNYVRSIKRIAKLAGFESIPSTKNWLYGKSGKQLINKIKRLPLSVNRHLFVAGAQAARMYPNSDERSAMWSIPMNESSLAYRSHRSKQIMSDKEKSSWPTQGYKVLGKASSIQKRKTSGLERKSENTISDIWEMQKAIILLIYSRHAFRTEPASWRLKETESDNSLVRPRGSRRFVVTNRRHKTSKSMGTLKITLDLNVSKALSKYLPKRNKVITKHDYFLINRAGNKLAPGGLSKLILRLTKQNLNIPGLGVRLFRVLKATSNAELIQKAADLQKEMGHSAEMQKTYVRKKQKTAK